MTFRQTAKTSPLLHGKRKNHKSHYRDNSCSYEQELIPVVGAEKGRKEEATLFFLRDYSVAFKMKLKIIILAVMMCITAFSCGDKNENFYSSPETSKESPTLSPMEDIEEVMKIPESKEAMERNFKDVPDVDKGPVLSIANTTAKAGEIAEVTVSVEGADLNWSNVGIHLTYPDVLKCVYQENDDRNLEYTVGEAAQYNSAVVAMGWRGQPPEELQNQNLSTSFFTMIFDGNKGQDGEIITLYLEVPEDAESGTVYPLDFYYMKTDMFRNIEQDISLEKYAFTHTKAGSITVE